MYLYDTPDGCVKPTDRSAVELLDIRVASRKATTGCMNMNMKRVPLDRHYEKPQNPR